MDDLGVIDHFTNVFSQYIDSGFGLLGGEVRFISATLIAIDVTLTGLFWALGGEEVIGKLLRKTLYVGAFAFIIGNFNQLAGIVFRSFAGLGLVATGSGLSAEDLLRPGRFAAVGVDAAFPLMAQIGQMMGFPDLFLNLDTIAVLFLAWLVVVVCFFVLAVQLFVTLIEFKLTTLAGFVLVPFALWNKTAFLAERVLGNVVSSGIKVLVLAVIVGIGVGLFREFAPPAGGEMTIDDALAIMLASLALFGLGLFGPGIATGLVSGAPQLGAGAAAGTALVVGGAAVGSGAVASRVARSAGGIGGPAMAATVSAARVSASAMRAGARPGAAASAGYAAFRTTFAAARAGLGAVSSGATSGAAGSGGTAGAGEEGRNASGGALRRAGERRGGMVGAHSAVAAAHVARSADRGGTGANPSLRQRE